MESLIGYGSDDDNEEIVQSKKSSSSQADVNYEEVQMDLSEESNDSVKQDGGRRHSSDSHSRNKDGEAHYLKDKDYYKKSDEHNTNRSSKYERSRYQDIKRDDKHDKYGRNRNSDDDRYKRDDNRDERRRDKYRDDKSSSSSTSGSRYKEYKEYKDDRGRESRKNRDERDRNDRNSSYDSRDNANKDEKRSYGNSSRDRHRSRSPRRSDYRNKRSSSRDRGYSGYSSKRYDRTSSKMDRLEKLGIELNPSNSGLPGTSNDTPVADKEKQEKDRFFMPGITGRFTEQIQRRKLLWQKKDNSKSSEISAAEGAPRSGFGSVPTPNLGGNLQTNKAWQNTTFAQDTDGKVANKFKRLMGIRSDQNNASKPGVDNLKKQEEMFNSMEAQYEVARTATHTMRGVGLGFGSFQR